MASECPECMQPRAETAHQQAAHGYCNGLHSGSCLHGTVRRLRAELEAIKAPVLPVCGDGGELAGIRRGCGRPIVWNLERPGDPNAAIRCADCLMVFCISCARRHFGKRPTPPKETDDAEG